MIDFGPRPIRESVTLTISSCDQFMVHPHIGTNAASNTAIPAASVAWYIPFSIPHPMTVYEVWVETGSLTTSNSIQIGVYDTAYNLLFSQATTVATASDTVNSSGMTDVVLPGPANYYMALASDGTRNLLMQSLAIAGSYQVMGLMEQTGLTGAALTNPGVPVAFTRTVVPLFGLNLRADAL